MTRPIDEDFEETAEDNYAINTGEIFCNEQFFWRDPENYNWTKYPHSIADQLIYIITHLLVENTRPSISHSDDRKEYLERKANNRYKDKPCQLPITLYAEILHGL